MNNIINYSLEGAGKGAIFGGWEGAKAGPEGMIGGAAFGASSGGVVGAGLGTGASAICEWLGAYGH